MSKLKWIVRENHASNEKIFICKPYSYEAEKHMSTDINNHNNLFRSLRHNLEEKERDDVIGWTHTKVLWSSCLLRP